MVSFPLIPQKFDINAALKTGIILLLFFAALILGLNLYAFYSAFLSSPEPLPSPPEKTASAADNFAEVIRMLDEREQRFKELLNAK